VQDFAHRRLGHGSVSIDFGRPTHFTGGVTPAPVVEPLSADVEAGFFFLSFFFGIEVEGVVVVVSVLVDVLCPAGGVPVDWSLQPTLSTGTMPIAAIVINETNLRKRLIGRAFPFTFNSR
jgi:hypothetical protein